MSDSSSSSSNKSGRPFGALPTLRTGQAHPHPEPIGGSAYSAVELMPGFRVVMLDQRRLPQFERYEFYTQAADVAEAIRSMVVRGAPAIGVAAAYGLVVAAYNARGDAKSFLETMRAADETLRASRPTAVNLMWALDRMKPIIDEIADQPHGARADRLSREARALHQAEVDACKRLGALGAEDVPQGATILTHCNAGALATGGYGTALGVIRAAHEAGKNVRVLACETRPYLQGARLTAFELAKDKIPVEVITDSMVGHFMRKGEIQLVVVGADRIAKNGDVANKIGTYGVATLAAAHTIPFYVAAPWSTIDLACANGDAIPIEQRPERELSHFALPDGNAVALVPDGVGVRNPSFDVTPASLVTAIVTERGVVRPEGEHDYVGPLARVAGAALALTLAVLAFGCSKGSESSDDPGTSSSGFAEAGTLPDGKAPVADCASEDTKDIFLIGGDNSVHRFHPPTLEIKNLGRLACPTGGATPTSMAVDRQGFAWVRHSDGTIWKVAVNQELACEATAFVPPGESFQQFGMGFATQTDGSKNEVLYLSDSAGAGLAKLDVQTLEIKFIGAYDKGLEGQRSELTGTGGGKLYGFFTTFPAQVAEISKGTGSILSTKELPGVMAGDAWAFSFYGGDFYVYTSIQANPQFPQAGGNSQITRYRPSDDSIQVVKENAGFKIVGAGVSTCAPTTAPR